MQGEEYRDSRGRRVNQERKIQYERMLSAAQNPLLPDAEIYNNEKER
jgi:hypothetical protein